MVLLDHISKGERIFRYKKVFLRCSPGRLEICGPASIMSTEQPPSTNFLANVAPRGPVPTTRTSSSIVPTFPAAILIKALVKDIEKRGNGTCTVDPNDVSNVMQFLYDVMSCNL